MTIIGFSALATEPSPTKKNRLTLQDLLNSTTSYPHPSTTVAGVRGLEETSGEVDTKARDYAAIDRLEHVAIHEEDLQKFIAEGKLK